MEIVLIAGAGKRGTDLCEMLKNHDIEVDAFLDNDISKCGHKICGIECYPIEHFKQCEKECIVYVSPANSENLYAQIKKVYSHVISSKVTNLLFSSPYNMGYVDFITPIGHFYSTYPDVSAVHSLIDYAVEDTVVDIKGLYFNEDMQRHYLSEIMSYFDKLPQWENDENNKFRYKVENPSIPMGDAVSLFSMIQIIKPKRIIEVGSGYSSAMFMDVNEYYMNNNIELNFIEPYPDTLKEITRESDDIILEEKMLQDVPVEYFDRLDSGDVLFIDSTHVSKEGSDVNYLFFEILPRLKSGVIIHLHDIFYPFTYPHEWIEKGRVWNEAYILRAFLEYNDGFEVLYSQNYIQKKYKEIISKKWQYDIPFHGASFWMRKK